jgi:hypothetical protein
MAPFSPIATLPQVEAHPKLGKPGRASLVTADPLGSGHGGVGGGRLF